MDRASKTGANCEACRTRCATVTVDDDDPAQPYILCQECSERLRKKALRPLEWFNLAAVHGWRKYLLRDDLYDQSGSAVQPDTKAYSTVGLPAPTLRIASESLERLVDYCITRWWVDESAYGAFKAFPTETVLNELDRRLQFNNWHVFATSLGIAANSLGDQASRWVRSQHDRACDEGLLSSWAEAAANCLPQSEGLQMTISALERLDGRQLRDRKMALLWFRSQDVLDWMESNIPKANITEDWGRLAAFSDLDWARVQTWLMAGRPLSLVAIDALSELIPRPGQAPLLDRLKPALRSCDDRSLIREALKSHLTQDESPRTSSRCGFILENLDDLRID